MNVRMTVRALATHVGENRLGVALDAGHALVHAPKRIAGAIMVKFRDGTDRFPAQGCMAILTGKIQISVRTAGLGVGLPLPACWRSHGQQSKNQSRQNGRNHGAPLRSLEIH